MKDLYRFVNGPWLDTHIIPDDRAVDGTFHKLRDDAEEDVHEIVKEDTGRAGTLYASFMDTDATAGLADTAGRRSGMACDRTLGWKHAQAAADARRSHGTDRSRHLRPAEQGHRP